MKPCEMRRSKWFTIRDENEAGIKGYLSSLRLQIMSVRLVNSEEADGSQAEMVLRMIHTKASRLQDPPLYTIAP